MSPTATNQHASYSISFFCAGGSPGPGRARPGGGGRPARALRRVDYFCLIVGVRPRPAFRFMFFMHAWLLSVSVFAICVRAIFTSSTFPVALSSAIDRCVMRCMVLVWLFLRSISYAYVRMFDCLPHMHMYVCSTVYRMCWCALRTQQ